MASFSIAGDTSGVITVQGPAVAGTNTLTWPANTGTAIVSGGSYSPLPGQINWNTTAQTTGFTAVAYRGYFCNTTSAGFTVTLPASPNVNDQIGIIDFAGTFATNNLTISPNGNKFNGTTISATLSTNREGLILVYSGSTQGWLAVASTTVSGAAVSQSYTASYLVIAGGGGGGSSTSSTGTTTPTTPTCTLNTYDKSFPATYTQTHNARVAKWLIIHKK